MNRRVLSLIVGGLAIVGCAHGRSSIREINRGPALPPASASEFPPIERAAPDADPSRPAVKTWSRADNETTRGQSPDPADDTPAEPDVKAEPAEPTSYSAPASATECGPSAPRVEEPPPDQTRAYDLKSEVSPGQLLGITMASVGGEAITRSEVQYQFNEFVRENLPPGQRIPRDDINLLVHRMLEQIIDRTVVVQEAKRTFLKSKNQQKMFNEFCEKQWIDRELPPMFRRNKVTNVRDLEKTLTEKGESLEACRQRFEREFLAREFLNMHLASRIKPTLPELRSYYEAHRDDYHREAKVGWREILVKGKNPKSRAKAESLLARVRHGEDFAKLAETNSDGPTAAKGGKWETGLGATSAPAVNSALETIALKHTSGVLEGPRGYHIIKIEERQVDGPAPFSVVQDRVYRTLFDQNFAREMEAYVKKLRSETLITYWINGNAPAPPGGEPMPPPKDAEAVRTATTAP